MNNVSEILAKLDKFNTVSMADNGKSGKSVVLDNGMKVSYTIEVSSHNMTAGSPFRAVLHISLDGGHYTWGTCDDDEDRLIVRWFILRDNDERDFKYDARELANKKLASLIEG